MRSLVLQVGYCLSILTFGIIILSIPIFAGVSLPEWRTTTSLPKKLARPAVVRYHDTIFAIGGHTTQNSRSHFTYAGKLGNNGRVLSWTLQQASGLEPGISHASAVVSQNGWVYLTGGFDGQKTLGTTYFSRIQNGNTITGWLKSSYQFSKRDLHTSELSKNNLYIIGGWNGSKLVDDILLAQVDEKLGELSASWSVIARLSPARAAHATILFNERLYVIGGLVPKGRNSVTVTDEVIYADINQDGTLGPWKFASSLPLPLAYHTAVLVESQRKIYVSGGRSANNGVPFTTNQVYFATIFSDGTLGNWQPVPSLSLSPARHRHASIYGGNGSIYLIGGEAGSKLNDVSFIPPLTLTKTNTPTGPVHEGDAINYTISYANTGLATQTITITDVLPFNLTVEPDSIIPADKSEVNGRNIVWNLGNISPGQSGQVSFEAKVALLPSLYHSELPGTLGTPGETPAYVLPVSIACDTYRFWANGVTRRPPVPNPLPIQVQIPPESSPTKMWLLAKGADTPAPLVGGQPAQPEQTSRDAYGASLWSAQITAEMLAAGYINIETSTPDKLNAVFLFDKNDPPFEQMELDAFYNTTQTVAYTLELPSVATQTVDVIIPFMDITYLKDNLQPDNRTTQVTVEFNGQTNTILANNPNLGNGLLMTQFPFTIGPYTDTITSTATLTVTVDTQDSVYTLGPRVCRPVYIENTAWLCSQQAGCISGTATNIPENFSPPGGDGIYLPIIFKASP